MIQIYLLSLDIFLAFKMPTSTLKSSLELPTYPPEYKDLLTELYSMGVPLIAEKIFTLLNPADLCSCLQVCTTWNYQVSTRPKFMDKVNAYRRQCKENAENLHVAKKSMECIVFPAQRQPLNNFTPNTVTQTQTNEIHSAPISFKCSKPTWHKSESSGRVSPSKRPRQPEDICGTKKSKKRLRRLWRSRDPGHTVSSWTVVTLVPVQDCSWGDDNKCGDKLHRELTCVMKLPCRALFGLCLCLSEYTIYIFVQYILQTLSQILKHKILSLLLHGDGEYCWHKHGFYGSQSKGKRNSTWPYIDCNWVYITHYWKNNCNVYTVWLKACMLKND